jgi:hypothetical protein
MNIFVKFSKNFIIIFCAIKQFETSHFLLSGSESAPIRNTVLVITYMVIFYVKKKLVWYSREPCLGPNRWNWPCSEGRVSVSLCERSESENPGGGAKSGGPVYKK